MSALVAAFEKELDSLFGHSRANGSVVSEKETRKGSKVLKQCKAEENYGDRCFQLVQQLQSQQRTFLSTIFTSMRLVKSVPRRGKIFSRFEITQSVRPSLMLFSSEKSPIAPKKGRKIKPFTPRRSTAKNIIPDVTQMYSNENTRGISIIFLTNALVSTNPTRDYAGTKRSTRAQFSGKTRARALAFGSISFAKKNVGSYETELERRAT